MTAYPPERVWDKNKRGRTKQCVRFMEQSARRNAQAGKTVAKVVKFGGSSLASAEQFKKAGEIIRADETRIYVVPSAPGKRYKNDAKVTDMLYACYALAESGSDFRKELAEIRSRYQEIIDGLELTLSLEEEFAVIEKNFREKTGSNYAASRGDFLSRGRHAG